MRFSGGTAAVFNRAGVLKGGMLLVITGEGKGRLRHKRGVEILGYDEKGVTRDKETVVPGGEMSFRKIYIGRSRVLYSMRLQDSGNLTPRSKRTFLRR